jgi:hypothetical protein
VDHGETVFDPWAFMRHTPENTSDLHGEHARITEGMGREHEGMIVASSRDGIAVPS